MRCMQDCTTTGIHLYFDVMGPLNCIKISYSFTPTKLQLSFFPLLKIASPIFYTSTMLFPYNPNCWKWDIDRMPFSAKTSWTENILRVKNSSLKNIFFFNKKLLLLITIGLFFSSKFLQPSNASHALITSK